MHTAADKKGISQPALTKSLKVLEDDLGTELFIRTHSGLEPTNAGTALFRHARVIDQEARFAELDIRDIHESMGGRIRIGVGPVLAVSSFPPILAEFHQQFPKVEISVETGISNHLVDGLMRESFDVVVCQFGAMFFPDKPRAFSEARRVLRPGGTFIFNVWDTIEHNEIAETVTVIAYLRSPAPFFLSNVQQDIKKRPEFRWVSASRIRDTLEPVLEHGPGPLIARPYERASLSDRDVVNDFCRQVLPALDPAALKRQPDTDNATVSAEAMRLLQQVFRAERPLPKPYGRDPKGFRKLLVATDPTVPGMTRPCLHEEVRQIVEARVTDGDWVADRLGVRFDDVAPPGITRDAAEQRFKRLRDIDQLCPVDADRQEALWQAAVAAAARDARPAARLARLLRGGPAT